MFSGPPLDVVRPVCRAGDKTERFDLGGDQAQEKLPGTVAWVGIDAGYFIAAALPKEPLGTCVFARGPEKGSGLAALRVPVEGGARKMSLTVYAGPKDLDTLRGYGRGVRQRHRLRRDGAPVRVLRAHPPLRDALVRGARRELGPRDHPAHACS